MYELVHVGAVRHLPFENISFSRSSIRPYPFKNFLQPFDLICSKIFFSRSTSSVRKFSLSVQPFENFLHPFTRSTSSVRKFSASVQPFASSVSNGLPTRFSSVRLLCIRPFERIPLGTFSRERFHFLTQPC